MDQFKGQRNTNSTTKGSWKKRTLCWSLVEASDYGHQGLSLVKGGIDARPLRMLQSKARKPTEISIVESGISGRIMGAIKMHGVP